MTSIKQRRFISEGIEYARDQDDIVREKRINHLEELREELDYSKNKIDRRLDKPKNWYSNKIQGTHGHEFDIREYEHAKRFLELEMMMKVSFVGITDINKAFASGPKRPNWYNSVIKDGLNIHDFYRIYHFLEYTISKGQKEGYIEDDEVKRLLELDILDW